VGGYPLYRYKPGPPGRSLAVHRPQILLKGALLTDEATKPGAPDGLADGGVTLWKSVVADHDLDATQLVTLTEACRAKDRLDKLDELLRGDIDSWLILVHKTLTEDYELKIDQALSAANATANLMKQLLASLRLPDVDSGKRPQARGGARGAYKSNGAGAQSGTARVSSLDRARARAAGGS
jgi:hypothetical protein